MSAADVTHLKFALDFIEAAERAPNLPALEQELRRALQEFGFTQFSLIALATRSDTKARRPVGLTQSCSADWSTLYHEKKYFNSDAVIHTAIRQSTPFSWDDLHPRMLVPTAKTMLDEGRDLMKVDGCFVIPTHDARGLAGLISMFHEGRPPDRDVQKAIKLMAIYAIERAKELHGIASDQAGWDTTCPLSLRQREVLAFSAIGKTDWEVAAILGIAEKTANHHFERAKAELGVATRAQAVAIAVHRGWVAL